MSFPHLSKVCLFAVLLSATASAATPEPFRVIVLPDTQKYHVTGQSQTFDVQIDWIVDHLDALNIAFVTHVGDVVEDAMENIDSVEWIDSDHYIDQLDGRVPYSISLGDHDYNRNAKPATGVSHFLRYFGPQRYADYDWYGGHSPAATSHYQFFTAGGRQYLHLNIECDAPSRGEPGDAATDELAWSRQVLERHPGVPTIVSTHAYLTDKARNGNDLGLMPRPEIAGPGRRNGRDIWRELVSTHDQIFLVFCGNEHGGPRGADGEYHRTSLNDQGRPVHEVLANYQSYPNGGNGWLRIVTFDEAAGELRFETYSPTLDRFLEDDAGTPRASRFALPLDFESRLAPVEASQPQ